MYTCMYTWTKCCIHQHACMWMRTRTHTHTHTRTCTHTHTHTYTHTHTHTNLMACWAHICWRWRMLSSCQSASYTHSRSSPKSQSNNTSGNSKSDNKSHGAHFTAVNGSNFSTSTTLNCLFSNFWPSGLQRGLVSHLTAPVSHYSLSVSKLRSILTSLVHFTLSLQWQRWKSTGMFPTTEQKTETRLATLCGKIAHCVPRYCK